MARPKVQSSIAARRWTSEDDALLAQLLEQGEDPNAIAGQLKRTIASVQRRVSDLRARTSAFTFADYLARRRSTYTQEWDRLQELQRDAAFREAKSLEDIERYLTGRDASLGLRDVARSAWTAYQQAKRKLRAAP